MSNFSQLREREIGTIYYRAFLKKNHYKLLIWRYIKRNNFGSIDRWIIFFHSFSSWLPFLSHNISSTSGLKELALLKRRNILVLHLSSCSKLVPTEIQARLQQSQLAWLRSSLDPLKPVCSAKCFQWRERANAHTHTYKRAHPHTSKKRT